MCAQSAVMKSLPFPVTTGAIPFPFLNCFSSDELAVVSHTTPLDTLPHQR